jgi:hypothetical protein
VARAVVGTAVVAGTAGYVHHKQQQRWDNQAAQQQAVQQQAYDQGMADAQAQQQQYAPPPPQYAPPPPQYAAPEPAPAPAGPSLTDQINQLAQLHSAGVLSDEEFAAAKQKLLAG